MGERVIKHIESFSAGKKQGHNDDNFYIGKDFVAVIDGVSNRSSVEVDGKQIKIAQIITEAIRKMDRPGAPVYAKTLSFEECVKFINLYIKDYLEKYGLNDQVGKMEATGVFYSRFHNQIWLVGDCKAIYDGKVAQNPLRIDEVVVDIRLKLVETLLSVGYSEEDLMEDDISLKIIKEPSSLTDYISNPELVAEIEAFRTEKIKQALRECGFSEDEIEAEGLIQKYYNPRDLQQVLKNNPDMGPMGYAVFNGIYTETRNCKVVNLPRDVKEIRMFSDGFPVDALNNNKDLGYAVRKIRRRAKHDKLSIRGNRAVHNSVRYSRMKNRKVEYAIDDASAVVIRIEGNERNQRDKGR